MFFEMKEIVREKITMEDIIDIVVSLGSNYPRRSRNTLIFQSIYHHWPNEDMSYKLYYYIDTGVFKAYTGGQKAYDIYGLIMETFKYRNIPITWEGVVEYVVNNSTISIGFGVENSSAIKQTFSWDFIDDYIEAEESAENMIQYLKQYSKNNLNVFLNAYYKGWIEEGISIEAMKKFNIKYSSQDNRIVIPHYDIFNHLVGVRGRALRKEEVDSGYKYMPMKVNNTMLSHPTSGNLYGIYRNKKTIKKQRQVILFESEKSVLKCETMYPNNNFSLAFAGRSISEEQIKLLLTLNVDRVIIALDRDYKEYYSKEGEVCISKTMNIANTLKSFFNVYIMVDRSWRLKEKESPIDAGKEIFEKLYKSKIRIK